MKRKMRYETYGKAPYWRTFYNEIKEKFTKNKHSEAMINSLGMKMYIPKPNKIRLSFASILSLIWIALPLATPLAVPTMRWGLK